MLGTISTSLLFAGWLLGALGGGVLSDKIGRKPVLFAFSVMCSLFALLAAFPNVFWLFMLFRLLVGICIGMYNVSSLSANWLKSSWLGGGGGGGGGLLLCSLPRGDRQVADLGSRMIKDCKR